MFGRKKTTEVILIPPAINVTLPPCLVSEPVSFALTFDAACAASAWNKVMTADGKPYYQNFKTRETSWNKPAGWVDPDLADAAVESYSNRSLQSGRGMDGMAETAGLAQEEAVATGENDARS